MALSRRDFLRCVAGCGGGLLLGASACPDGLSGASLRAAVRWLVARQSPDGAWRSGVYAAFRGGDALTPLVLWALQSLPAALQPVLAMQRGRGWLAQLPQTTLVYPLFTASYAAQFWTREGDTARALAWADVVERLRISRVLGWPADSPACGAWSDSTTPPRHVQPLPDMFSPNLSATVLGLQALAAAGRETRAALPFLERCQNFAGTAPSAFDDGGFFFAEADPIRNKAGTAGHDSWGTPRFRSYGAATSDGLLALRACGLPVDHPRIRAATTWLLRHSHGAEPGGDWPADRQTAAQSLIYYQAQGLAAALGDSSHREFRHHLANDLATRQSREGWWRGSAPDSCEDEPLVATAFALRALALCR
jgi:hypothetical protein